MKQNLPSSGGLHEILINVVRNVQSAMRLVGRTCGNTIELKIGRRRFREGGGLGEVGWCLFV